MTHLDNLSLREGTTMTVNLWNCDKFEDYNVAKAWQADTLRKGLEAGYAVHSAALEGERDYDTKIYWWRTHVRFIEEVHESS